MKTTDPVFRQQVESLLLHGQRPSDIERQLALGPKADLAPRRRTIERIARELREAQAQDTSDPWSLSPEGVDTATILWVLAASLADGWRLPITMCEARWVTAIHAAVPDIGPLSCRTVARLYMGAEARNEPTTWLDQALAVGPWRNSAQRELYEALGLPRLSIAMTAAQAAR